MQRIEQQNRDVTAAHATAPGRPYVTLVYFSGFDATSTPGGLVAQREALAGVAAMQRREFTRAGVLVRILVANGGAQMLHGRDVTRMLANLAAQDSSVIGVLGLGQSRQSTIDTIKELTIAGLPMIASALTADTVANSSPMYYQVLPQNRREAEVGAHYAHDMLLRESLLARRVRIIHSNDRTDTYSRTLAEDAAASFAQIGFTIEPTAYYKPSTPPPEYDPIVENAPAPGEVGRDTCGFDGLVFYAGRTQEFGPFLSSIHASCRQKPAILAGDDVSNYVADPDKRTQSQSVTFDYISLAVGQQSCEGPSNSDLYTTLQELFPEDCASGLDPSLDGHAALAYDATWTMIIAVQHLLDDGVQTITPAAVWHAISGISGKKRSLQGETGTIDFDPTIDGTVEGHVPVDKAIAILKVTGPGDRKPSLQASCGQQSAKQWCPANRPADT
jgi:ABC-type branched-subunit amino acid transport system substrate-binding protein